MQYLKCRAQDCIYNADTQCSANAIRVSITGQETFCDTYTREDAFVAAEIGDLSIADTEFGDIGSPRIACGVFQCAYNRSFHCHAHGVHIGSPHDGTICSCRTYRPK